MFIKIIILCFFLFSFSAYSTSYDSLRYLEEEALFRFHLLKNNLDYASIASKYVQKISSTPAMISVINEEQIRNSGATHLPQILKLIPGVETFLTQDGYHELAFRGIRNNSNILIMLDGHTINNFYDGLGFINFPLDNIQRIEVIRGPGSSIHGTNAFTGIINIISKEYDDIDLFNVSLGDGREKSFSFLTGKYLGENRNLTFNYSAYSVEGQLLEPETPNISDNISNNNEQHFLSSIYSFNKSKIRLSFFNENRGSYIGRHFVIDDEQYIKSQKFVFDFSTTGINIFDDAVLNTRFYFDRSRFENYRNEGGVAWGWATGYSLTNYESLTTGTELQINCRPFQNHNIVAGLQFEYFKIYDYKYLTTYEKPYDSQWSNDYLWGTGLNVANDRGYLYNWHDLSFNQNNSRNIIGFFLQNEWTMNENFISTLGFRFDYYNDFGSTFNPKVGFVYNPIESLYIKGAFATAFRAPTFQELYDRTQISIKNGSMGNPDLKAETIQTSELGLEYKSNNSLLVRLNAFNNKIKDNIFPQNVNKLEGASGQFDIYENINGIDVYGFETEFNYNHNVYNYFSMNTSWFRATNKGGYTVALDQHGPVRTDYESYMMEVPQFRFNLIFNIDKTIFGLLGDNFYNSYFVLNTTYSFASNRYNNMLDIVPSTGNSYSNTGGRRWKIDEYHLINIALSTTDNLSDNLKLAFSVYNLTNEKMYDNYFDVVRVNDSLKDWTLDKVFPLQGRTIRTSVTYKF